MTLALRDNDSTDIFYKAVQTLSKSVDHYVEKFTKDANLSYFYFPIIALDCPLFEFKLLESGETELSPIQEVAYLSRNPNSNNLDSTIDVVTKTRLAEYAEVFSNAADSFIKANKKGIEAFVAEIKKPVG